MIISIIIPTRERADYLKESIQTALQIPDRNIEIIISDNASTDGTKQVISEISDPRVKYINTGKRVSMRENFEFGLHNSSGDYVIFFGDDDGILPRQFKFLRRILEKERPDALGWNVPSIFVWPGEERDRKSGSVTFDKRKLFGKIHKCDSDACRKHLLACKLNQLRFIPGVYAAGCVSRDYWGRIAAPDGTYFNSSVPDAYFEFRALLEGGNFLHVDHAFVLGGQSPTSGAKLFQTLPDANDPRSRPLHRGIAELKLDKLTDVIEHTLSLTLLSFSTLETVRARFPKENQIPDYLAWYRYVLSENSSWHSKVRGTLRGYAIKSGTLSEFEQAESGQADNPALKTYRKVLSGSGTVFSEVKEIIRNHVTRLPILPGPKKFRLSGKIAEKNTILTAVNIYDSTLADDYEHILDGTGFRDDIWKQVVKRSRVYPLRKKGNT
uniref:Glycosyl transferase family 2 n=1 Tax=Candidatus Kentrum sp. LFY TaxID=2126342 RepID=A0A450WBI5_9GAMM|nr:MAG: Glycosyl transferase family 2 [Candidatus Kentron sp. LFY]